MGQEDVGPLLHQVILLPSYLWALTRIYDTDTLRFGEKVISLTRRKATLEDGMRSRFWK